MKEKKKKNPGRPIKDKKSGKKVSCFTFSLSPAATEVVSKIIANRKPEDESASSFVSRCIVKAIK